MDDATGDGSIFTESVFTDKGATPAGEARQHGPAPLSPVAAHFADAVAELALVHELGTALHLLVRSACRVVDGAELATVTVTTVDGGWDTVASSEPSAVKLDLAQYQAGRGPCLDAITRPGPALVRWTDLADGGPWPALRPVAEAVGVRGGLSVGLFPTGDTARFGSLNLYFRDPDAIANTHHDTAVMFAAHAATVIHQVSNLEAAARRTRQLARALEGRDVIGQAKGILMSTRDIDADAAFDLLAKTSQHRNIKLRDVAALVIGGELPDSDGLPRRTVHRPSGV